MFTDHLPSSSDVAWSPDPIEIELASFPGGCVVQLAAGHPNGPDADVTRLHAATIRLTNARVSAVVGPAEWTWSLSDLEDVFHGGDEPWTILAVPGVDDHGVEVWAGDVARFRSQLDDLLPPSTRVHRRPPTPVVAAGSPGSEPPNGLGAAIHSEAGPRTISWAAPDPGFSPGQIDDTGVHVRAMETVEQPIVERVLPVVGDAPGRGPGRATAVATRRHGGPRPGSPTPSVPELELAGLQARGISAWFGTHLVLAGVSLEMVAGEVTALIGPSGCGKSTFLRILNRMHEMIPSAALAGEVLLDGIDIYDPSRKVTDARRQIGMVFQKPNPFPAMSIYDNVLASFQLTGTKRTSEAKDDVVEACLRKGGLWNEVRDRLRQPGGSLSGGQQQRLCIARALAIRPRVLLMDEPCSALDPTSTRRIEQTIAELKSEVTIVIVTHNMQQAVRVSDQCAFFLAEQGTPGAIVEHGPTEAMFHYPQDQRTSDYVNGRFG